MRFKSTMIHNLCWVVIDTQKDGSIVGLHNYETDAALQAMNLETYNQFNDHSMDDPSKLTNDTAHTSAAA